MNVTKPAKYAPPKYRWRNVIIPNNSKFHIFGRISPVKQKVQIAFQRILVRRSIHKTSIWRLANTDVFESGDPILSIDTLSHQTLKIGGYQLHNSLWFTSRTQNKELRSQFSLKWGKFPCPMRCIKKYHCNNYSTFIGFTRDLCRLRKLSANVGNKSLETRLSSNNGSSPQSNVIATVLWSFQQFKAGKIPYWHIS